MKLSDSEAKRFYLVWWSLLYYVNQERKLVKDFPKKVTIADLPVENTQVIRNELWKHPELLESFLTTNPDDLPAADLSLASSWRYRIENKFFIFRHLKKYSIFISSDTTPKAYGVLGLVSELEKPFPFLPVFVKAVLLPFEDKVIYDSVLLPYNIAFGGGIKSSLNESYREAKSGGGIITSLTGRPS